MATIAMQRGYSSFSTANTPVTLFTQSGGSSTKVMINQLMIFSVSGQISGYNKHMITYTPSGGYPSIIGVIYHSASAYALQWDPVMGSKPQMIANGSYSGGTPQHGGQFMLGGDGSVSNPSIGSGTSNAMSNFNISVTNYPYGYSNHVCPPSFFIGPSDSVKFVSSTGSSSYYIAWSFTTITEA